VSFKTCVKKYWLPVYLIPLILLSGVLAYFDNIGYQMYKQVQNPGQVYNAMVTEYMQLFHGLVFVSIFGMSFIVYYYRSFRDSLAFFVFSLSVLWSGLWDLLYYQFSATPGIPETLTHLNGTPLGTTAAFLNDGVVTPDMLVLNAALFLGVGLPLAGLIRRSDRLSVLDRVPDW